MEIVALLILAALQQEDVATLVRQLGDDAVSVRESAESKLRSLGRERVPDLLLAAKDHPDLEVRARIRQVVKHLTEVRWHTDLALARRKAALERKPLLVFSTKGPLDGFV
jgi:hypothetical protein